MELVFQNFLFAKILVDNQLSYIQAFWLESKLSVYVNDPFKQKCSWSVSYFSLYNWNVVWVNHEIHFISLHIFIYWLGKLWKILWIFDWYFISLCHFFQFTSVIVCNPLFENIVNPLGVKIWISFFDLLKLFWK